MALPGAALAAQQAGSRSAITGGTLRLWQRCRPAAGASAAFRGDDRDLRAKARCAPPPTVSLSMTSTASAKWRCRKSATAGRNEVLDDMVAAIRTGKPPLQGGLMWQALMSRSCSLSSNPRGSGAKSCLSIKLAPTRHPGGGPRVARASKDAAQVLGRRLVAARRDAARRAPQGDGTGTGRGGMDLYINVDP